MSNFFSGDFFQDTFMFSFTVAFVSDLVPFSRYTLLFFLWSFYGIPGGLYGISMGFLWGVYMGFLWCFYAMAMALR